MSDPHLGVGDTVPGFTLADQDGRHTSLRELLAAGCLVLFFYPKDDTYGCTVEACAFRDEREHLAAAGASLVGVSSDEVESHRRFAEKHRLGFRLLADRGGALRRRFGVRRAFGFVDGRVTYVIDSQAVIRHVFDSQLEPQRHVAEAVHFVRSLRGLPSMAAGADAQDGRGALDVVGADAVALADPFTRGGET